jgi:hypothetical protein
LYQILYVKLLRAGVVMVEYKLAPRTSCLQTNMSFQVYEDSNASGNDVGSNDQLGLSERPQNIPYQNKLQKNLDVYLSALKQYENDEDKYNEVLSECCGGLQDDPRYKASAEYLNCWIDLIDRVEDIDDKLQLFHTLNKKSIGLNFATFYIAFASVLESTEDHEDLVWASKIYEKGIQRQAKPLEKLQKHFIEFKKRNRLEHTKDSVQSNIPHTHATVAAQSSQLVDLTKSQKEHPIHHLADPTPYKVGYDREAIYTANGEYSFEENRARLERYKLASQQQVSLHQNDAKSLASTQSISHTPKSVKQHINYSINVPDENIIREALVENEYIIKQNTRKKASQPSVALLQARPTPQLNDENSNTKSSAVISNNRSNLGRRAREDTDGYDPLECPPSPTVNTKKAIDDIEAMFAGPLDEEDNYFEEKKRARKKKRSLPPSQEQEQFQIYEEPSNSQIYEETPNQNEGFQIYDENQPQQFQIFEQQSTKKPPVAAGPINFNDSHNYSRTPLSQCPSVLSTSTAVSSSLTPTNPLSTTKHQNYAKTMHETTTQLRAQLAILVQKSDNRTIDHFSSIIIDLHQQLLTPALSNEYSGRFINCCDSALDFDVKRLKTHRINLSTPDNRAYVLDGSLGEGAYAFVALAKCDDENSTYACKIQNPPCPWEFYITDQVQERLKSTRYGNRFISPTRMYLYDNASLLLMPSATYGKNQAVTLQDLINFYRMQGKHMEEILVVYYVIEMLKMVEILHETCGIIHADIKPDVSSNHQYNNM